MIYSVFTSFHFKPAVILLLITALMTTCFPEGVVAQDTLTNDTDNVVIDTTSHSAHKASIYSLVLPGLGQAYNKKYWKIPVIYAGFGALAYNFSVNRKEMNKFTEAYRYKINGETYPIDNEYVTRYNNPNDLLKGRDFYRRRVELSVILTAAWYLLNVVDAAVDAHFYDYDVSEDLSINVSPVLISTPSNPLGTGGIRLSMNF